MSKDIVIKIDPSFEFDRIDAHTPERAKQTEPTKATAEKPKPKKK